MKIRFKKLHPQAVPPTRARYGDAGFDLAATSIGYNALTDSWDCKTSISVEIPEGYVGLIFPRSGIRSTGMLLTNSVGVIDSGYRGEIMFSFHRRNNLRRYEVGDRIGQLVILPLPAVEMVEVDELSDSERGVGGFGSTGA